MANATPNPTAEAAAKSVHATNAAPPADAAKGAPAAPAAPEAEQQAFSPDTTDALDLRGSGTSTMPREWLDSTKTVKYQNRGDSFGAIAAGDDKGAPADLALGNAGVITDEESAADETGIATGQPLKVGEAEEATEEATADGDAVEAQETQAPETDETTEKVEAKKEPEKKEPDKVELLKQTKAIRRTALDAMRIEAEKRQLEQRLRDERKARENDMVNRAEFEKRLKTAPVDERLRLIGIRDKDALLEMQLRGEIPDFKEPEVPVKTEPQKPADDPEKIALSKRIADLEAINKQREAQIQQHQATQIQQAAATNARAILAAPEVAGEVKLTLASGPAAIADVMTRAEQLWVASGSKQGDVNRHVIAAAKEAEAILAEQYAPIFAAMGVKPSEEAKPAAGKQPGPVIPAKPATTKKPNVAGKNLGARGATLEDDLPMNAMLRDAIIKRERGWGGSQ